MIVKVGVIKKLKIYKKIASPFLFKIDVKQLIAISPVFGTPN